MTNEKIINKANELNNSVEAVYREIKKVASQKCRLKKMPGRIDYTIELQRIEAEEELLKQVRDYLKGPKKNVNTLTDEAIATMDYFAVCKALRCIQSKKTHTKYADDCLKDSKGLFIPGSGESYKEACRIESLLKARRDEVKPEDSGVFFASDVFGFIEYLEEATDKTDAERYTELLTFFDYKYTK